MTRPGWYPDPTGRFPHRWHDGDDWTASVVDPGGQQGYDALPPVGAPPVPGIVPPPPRAATPMPPPPPGAASTAAPTVPSMWEPAPPQRPAEPTQSWQPGQPWQSAPAQQQPTQSYGYSPSPPAWQPGPARGTGALAQRRSGPDPIGLIMSTAGTVMIALSLFVLDWAPALSFADLRTYMSDLDGLKWQDTLVKAYTQWLGYGLLVVTCLAVAFAAGGRTSARRLAHVGAALAAAVGAVLGAFVIVRAFVGPGEDPEFGAWLLVGGYLVMVTALVVGARRA